MMNYYLAREKKGDLYLYADEPEKGEFSWSIKNKAYQEVLGRINIGKDMYPEIKWEDESPVGVQLFFYIVKDEKDEKDEAEKHDVVVNPDIRTLRSNYIEDDAGTQIVFGVIVRDYIPYYACRNEDGRIFLYKDCPLKLDHSWEIENEDDFQWTDSERILEIPSHCLPEVKWEDEHPTKVCFEIRKLQ